MDFWTLVPSTTRYFILKVLHQDKTFSLQYTDPESTFDFSPHSADLEPEGAGVGHSMSCNRLLDRGTLGSRVLKSLPEATYMMGRDQNPLLPSLANQSNYVTHLTHFKS